ncbi:uncharacterized protein F4812DRAFT_463054 [Daldinia caldariorum]|uniref:uncharacterized protein n=1 Tax=Daldinia caldariorum TaxID=326644 RepID=UPI002007C890|nr:uncharacterized protein F4812DRAFT_463054 [Daldinia caldariorum]KAI1463997.1 hypothetical protein F4812DRAFT_463054 [Daldinia caldariorum]
MAVRPGEENVATLFGDVHYFYGPPEANPPHHRFDKGSYVYLFENANDRRARIEIANHPGTEDQDAFDGYLDRTRIQYSYKQQCLVNILVEGVAGPPIDQSQWHLPTYDPRNENKYHYKLHSLDIYFWTHGDALQFVNGIRRVLPASQVDVADEPAPPPHPYGQSQETNALVQKLENVAISDPKYSSPKPAPQGIPTFAPPPTSAATDDSKSTSPQNFVPIAYNPAAPAAAEQRIHREKTPPPEDDGQDPLAAAVARDHVPPYTPGYGATNFSAPPGGPGIPGPPQVHPGLISPGLVSPGLPTPGVTSPGFPPSQFGHLQRSATVPVSGLASPGLVSPYGANFPGSPGFAPPPPPQNMQHHPTPPPVQSPGLPPAPPGGYSNYGYSSTQQAPGGVDYSIHQQLYRPTEQEHSAKYGVYKPKVEGQSRLGQNAERLEKGVTGMLKKFEKRFG